MDATETKHCSKCDRPDSADNLVGCDTCEAWVHFGCANVTDSIADANRSWKCDKCLVREDDSVSQSRMSLGHSASSKHSSRASLVLRIMEEQKALRLRQIAEEELAQAVARKKRAAEEEQFIKQKYALLLGEADELEDGASRKSRLSSRASRDKVRSWLSEQVVGAAQPGTVPPSNVSPSVVSTGVAHQSTVPVPIVSDTNVSIIPTIVESKPASTSTPNSANEFEKVSCPSAIPPPPVKIPVRRTKSFVSHTEITFDIPPKPRAQSSHRSAPPSVVDYPPMFPLDHLPASVASVIPAVTSNEVRRDSNTTAVVPSSRQTCGDRLGISMAEVFSTNYGCSLAPSSAANATALRQTFNGLAPVNSIGNTPPVAVAATSSIGDPLLRYSSSRVGFASYACPTVSASLRTPCTSGEPISSIPWERVTAHSSNCQPTWVNNSLPSTTVRGTTFANNNGGFPVVSAPAEPLAPSVVPDLYRVPTVHAVPNSMHPGVPMSGRQQAQQPTIPVRNGPSSEQIAARAVMPKELPIFSGDPQDWPLFYSSFSNSTEACGYSEAENLARLQRCLKGNALEAVKSRLLMPQSVPFVIETLRRLYGRPEILMQSLLQKLRTVPSPKTDNLQSQITFGLAVQNVVDHMAIANLSDHMWNPTLLHELVEKLPSQLKMQWSYFKSRYTYTNLAIFSAFMTELVMMASDVTIPMDTLSISANTQRTSKDKQKLFVHTEDQSERKSQFGEKNSTKHESMRKTCVYCANVNHEIAYCKQFKALDVDGRWKAVKQKNLCRGCLVPHRKWPCRTKRECGVDGCRVHHHSLLHSVKSTTLSSAEVGSTNAAGNSSNVVHQNLHCAMAYSLFRYLPVTIYGNGQQISTYAFLDDGSSSTLLESSIAAELGITGPTDSFCLSWTGNITREEKESQRISLVICGAEKKFTLHNVRTVKQLRLPTQTLCYEDLKRAYHHLKGLPIQSYENATPGIIIGIEHVRLLTAQRLREGRDNEPVAMKTRLGWCIFGKNSLNGETIEQLNTHIAEEPGNREIHQWMKQFFTVEEASVTIIPEAEEDKRARRIMEATTRRVDGAFETGLLWKYNHVHFPDSYPMALRRLEALEKRISKDSVLEARVREQIAEYETKGYAHRITIEESQSTDPSKVWYLPLGVVQNPKKPDKLRLIWDAKARAGGTSFNDMLLKGPDLLVGLMSVLLRFRQRNIAVVGDIKEMFHQVRIREEDKQSQRFLFRQNPESSPQIYVMDVATFGATCSPSLAQFIKNKNAEEFAETFPRAARAITDNHYVDDFLDSVDTEEEAITLINDVKHVHSQAGFEIRNFCSNSAKVLTSIGEPEAPQKISMNLEKTLEPERVLGMIWRPKEDVFTFERNNLKEEIQTLIESAAIPTKRQVLRTVMSLFDPLGLISHFVVLGKILMQQIWRSGTDWDEPIAEELVPKWLCWCQYMQQLGEVAVPRCFFKGVNSSALKKVEAHVFVDASELACAAVMYLRYVDNGKPRCALVAAKTKVAPLKTLSIPRLELQAAMIGTRLMDSVLQSLDLQVTERFLWSDSSTVLCWLRSDSRRYHQFVAFRVGEILTTTSLDEWHYVPSKLNIADAATKWKEGPNFDPENPWYAAPEFLQKPRDQWPEEPLQIRAATDCELRSVFLFHGTLPSTLLDVSRFSNWRRLLRTAAYILRAVQRFKGAKGFQSDLLVSKELADAEILIWRQVQAESYPDEYAILQRNSTHPHEPTSIPKSSSLYKLSAFVDQSGIIRMNSRISAEPTAAYNTKYPILLPRKHPAVYLLADGYHRRFLHGNGETVCNEMRQQFYVPGLRVLIRQVSKQCLTCRVKKAVPHPPMMAALPEARVTGMIRPFTHTGVDYFGPILVRQGRSLVKRWVALFTCLTVRAVHLEIVHNLGTQSCVMAIRRFVARRGSPKTFHSDNGTNFLGASNILSKQIQDIQEDCAVTFTNATTSWVFNPPSAPHMGGSWERMVRSVKAAMLALADHPHHPSDDVLETVAIEAESIVNSRPLTYIPLESSEQEALTPNHFLLFGTKGITQPATTTDGEGSTFRDSWRLAQYLVNHFWTRWVREYLPTITSQAAGTRRPRARRR